MYGIEWEREPPYGDNPNEPGEKYGWRLQGAWPFRAEVFYAVGMWMARLGNRIVRNNHGDKVGFESAELAKHAVEIEIRDRAREIVEALKER
jgi:hypothetical protein